MVCVIFFKRRCETRVYMYKKFGVGINGSNRATQREKVGKKTHQQRKGLVEMREPHLALKSGAFVILFFYHALFDLYFLCR